MKYGPLFTQSVRLTNYVLENDKVVIPYLAFPTVSVKLE